MEQRHRARAQQVAGVAVAALLLASSVPAAAADAVLYRIFLRDGATLISYGEFARVAGRVVFSIPLGDVQREPHLELVSIPESSVDWDRTDRYAEAARANRYAETRGEDDFTLLSSEVARVLNEVALTSDPARRMTMLGAARRALAEWPAKNYGYRANDVAQLSAMLDEVVSELRVAAGESSFDLSFVANTVAPLPVPLLPAPGLRESIEQAFVAARTTPDPGERVSLLRAITDALRESARAEPWAAATYRRAALDLEGELRIGKAYGQLAARALMSADRRARRADVRGVEAVVARVLKADDSLGRLRPQETAALLASLDAKLDAARRLRLARDAWELRADVLRAYRKRLSRVLDPLRRSRSWLEDIRQLAGPNPKALDELQRRAGGSARELDFVTAPPEADAVHQLLGSSIQMSIRAAATRRAAISGGSMSTAWDASAAAAGALMLLDRVLDELTNLTAPPRLK
jgi:hypothetical protein